jgi:hypothetical protein
MARTAYSFDKLGLFDEGHPFITPLEFLAGKPIPSLQQRSSRA